MQGKSVEILYFFAVVFVRADPGPHLVMLSEVETSLSSRASCVHSIAVRTAQCLSCRPHGRDLSIRGPHFEITYRCVAFILLSSDRLLPGLCVLFCPRL